MIDHSIVEVCRAYAELMCSARRLYSVLWPLGGPRGEGPNYTTCLRAAARELYACAPVDAMPYLDTVKKVLEIDTAVTTVSVVLLRASLIEQAKVIAQATERVPNRWDMSTNKPTDPDAGSDLIPVRPCQ